MSWLYYVGPQEGDLDQSLSFSVEDSFGDIHTARVIEALDKGSILSVRLTSEDGI